VVVGGLLQGKHFRSFPCYPFYPVVIGGHHGRDRMVDGILTTYTESIKHH